MNGMTAVAVVEKKIVAELTNGVENASNPESPARGVSGTEPLANGEACGVSEDSIASSTEGAETTMVVALQDSGCADRITPEAELEEEGSPGYSQLAEAPSALLVSRE